MSWWESTSPAKMWNNLENISKFKFIMSLQTHTPEMGMDLSVHRPFGPFAQL